MDKKLLNIKIVPESSVPKFEQRETGITHTPYSEEVKFFSQIQQGNTENIKQSLSHFIKKGLVIGRLSKDNLRQMQYWAVSCVTLGIRYALQGGLDEMTAYNLSDSYIIDIDRMKSTDSIITYLENKVLELTLLVAASKKIQRKDIQECLNYIDRNLNNKIYLSDLAKITGHSSTYLSKLFKKEVGINVSGYILSKKLDSAKELLLSYGQAEMIAYLLGFCSQSHFIKCFKKQFGITPQQYRQNKESNLKNMI